MPAPQTAAPTRYFTAADAAKLTGLSYWYIRHLAHTGAVPVAAICGRRAPLFDGDGIAWLAARRRKAPGGS
jgi:hypothetical protein